MDSLDARLLKGAASRLVGELESLQLPFQFEPRRTIEDLPWIDGGWITLAKWRGYPSLCITFDRCPGFKEPKFWVGFYSPSAQRLRAFVDSLPPDLRYKRELDDGNFVKAKGKWRLTDRPSTQDMKRPFFETYKQGYGSYFGIYDVGTIGKSPKLNITRVAGFVERVVNANYIADENASEFEGAAKPRYVLHRKREVRLRARKIEQALHKNGGRLVCEVEDCGFDFKEKYGELGAGYAHVHHKKQLSKAPKEGTDVSLADLAVVCANCHAMIHKGGQCHSLEKISAALRQSRLLTSP